MVSLRGLTLTAARPRIIVPLFARDPAALCPLAKAASADPAAELVELRLDPLPADEFLNALALVRGIVDKPLVVTIRTRAEGGELALTPDAYAAHCRALLARGGVDVLDIEWRACGAFRAELRDAAHAAGAAALFSEHHFDATPATDAMADTLTGMADAGADIAKLAVMPRCAADAARLGAGVARLLHYQAIDGLASGELTLILEAMEPEPAPVHLLYTARGLAPLKLRKFLDFATPMLRQALAGIAATR